MLHYGARHRAEVLLFLCSCGRTRTRQGAGSAGGCRLLSGAVLALEAGDLSDAATGKAEGVVISTPPCTEHPIGVVFVSPPRVHGEPVWVRIQVRVTVGCGSWMVGVW